MAELFKIAIVGSGPGGLSAAARAAELGLSHVLLEAQEHPANTIFKYQKGKHVMAEPGILPLRSSVGFAAGKRETVLETWSADLARLGVNIRHGANVTAIEGSRGAFVVRTASGESVTAECVVLAIGVQGNIRKLGVPGEDLPNVQYQLDDPEEYVDENIVVVGGGDAGVENALALSPNNLVFLFNREAEFNRCKDGNRSLVTAAVKSGRMETRLGTRVLRVEEATDGRPLRMVAMTPGGEETLSCHRVIARLGATPPRKLVEGFGVRFPSADPAAVPELSERYESNVPGLYIVGALGGYPLIKQAMNQGYEVVEYILGRAVEPADEPLLKQRLAGFRRAASVSDAIAIIRANVPLLSGLTMLQLRELLLESSIHAPKAGEILFERNEYTNSLYCIVEGEVIVHDAEGEQTGPTLRTGAFFGEMGLISGRRRSATVSAGQGCVLIETPRNAMLTLIDSVQSVRRTLDQVSLKRAVDSFLGGAIDDGELDALVQDATIRTFTAGQALCAEGDKADGLYLIRRGSVTISRLIGRKDVVLSYVAAGNIVGEMALMSGTLRSATVRATVYTEVIMLESARVTDMLAHNDLARAQLEALFKERLRSNQAMEEAPESGSLINFLMQQGAGEATDLLLIDESLCTRCNNCEKACSDTHGGTSRLDRETGPTFANIHVPTSCRHCEHPLCMKDCPPDAIHRSANGEVFISDSCIGCGNCERNCPYGVIRMAPLDPERRKPSLLAWLLLGIGTEPGMETPFEGEGVVKKAVKCDMCRDLPAGPACVRACPTAAAFRVGPERFLDIVLAKSEG